MKVKEKKSTTPNRSLSNPEMEASKRTQQEILTATSLSKRGMHIEASEHLADVATRCPPNLATQLLLAGAQLVDSKSPAHARHLLSRAIEIDPNCGAAHLGMAIVLNNLGQIKPSIQHLRDAILLPLSPEHKILASVMLTKCGLLSPALEMSKTAFYESGRPLDQASNCLDIALQIADWDFAEELIALLRDAHQKGMSEECNEAAKTHILWCDDEETNIKVIRAWSKRTYPNYVKEKRRISSDPDGRRLRVGYLSSDFRNHPTALLINGLFRHHDKSRFDVHLYCSGWDDGSDIRKKILGNAEKIYLISDLADSDAAKLILSHDLDILVELNGPTKSNRMGVLSYRPAPIQICYLGWPGSAGGRFIDYIIADQYIVPENNAALYPEEIIWLGDSYQINDYEAQRLAPTPPKRKYGFQEDAIVVGMFNTINKVRREVWQVWMEIINSCPRAIFWILDPGVDAREYLARETINAGLALDRIVIAPRVPQDQHLERLQVCDLILDPWPIGGHTSTADALFAGVPIIAMEGRSYGSRVSGGLLHSVGLGEFVATNRDHYTKMAKFLLSEGASLLEAKAIITKLLRGSGLFQTRKTVNDIEKAFEHLAKESFEKQ